MKIKPKRLTFEELSERLRQYEQKYSLSTIEFYRRFQNGELGDDDDLLMWSGLYYISLSGQFGSTSISKGSRWPRT